MEYQEKNKEKKWGGYPDAYQKSKISAFKKNKIHLFM